MNRTVQDARALAAVERLQQHGAEHEERVVGDEREAEAAGEPEAHGGHPEQDEELCGEQEEEAEGHLVVEGEAEAAVPEGLIAEGDACDAEARSQVSGRRRAAGAGPRREVGRGEGGAGKKGGREVSYAHSHRIMLSNMHRIGSSNQRFFAPVHLLLA